MTDRFLPDKAIDILDEACAKEAMLQNVEIQEKVRYTYDKLKQLYIDDTEDYLENDINTDLQFNTRNKIIDDLKSVGEFPKITSKSIMDVVSEIIGSNFFDEPAPGIEQNIYDALSSKIIGQETAVASLCDSIMRASSGICSPDKPKGIFMFVGSRHSSYAEFSQQR
jgi:ATP-dependent Clp protease ATP-binding subunit ClpC